MSNARTNGKHADAGENIAAEDPHEWNQQRRFEQISRAREYAMSALVNTQLPEAGVDDTRQLRAISAAVKNYVAEVEPLLIQTAAGGRYLDETPLHPIEIKPPQEAVEFFEENQRKIINRKTEPQSVSVEIDGLNGYLELNPPYTRTWGIEKRVGGHIETEAFTAEVPIPRKTSEEAYRAVNLFLTEIGLGVEITGEDHRSDEPGL